MTTIAEHVLKSYLARACFLCERFGDCKHREFEVEAAYIVAEFNRKAQPKKPPGSVVPMIVKKARSS